MRTWSPVLLLFALLTGCSGERVDTKRTTISLWHFWSEPAQESAVRELVDSYEADHPDVRIELTPLNWADGKSKLQLAFNAGTQPDIVHLGLDWFGEFDASGVFAPFDNDNMIADRAALWVVNARALVHWTDGETAHRWGLVRSDAHNIIKRCLPLLWEAGAPSFYTRSPIHADMNELLVDALWALRDTVVKGALQEPSRSLDERFLRGEIEYLYTGAWITDMARERGVTSFEVVPKPSILNGDVLCISKGSEAAKPAAAFIAWITAYPQAARFCHAVADAGFPAANEVFADTTFMLDPIQFGFLRTAQVSRPLPASPVILRIEPIVEDLIERCYTAASKDEVAELVDAARAKVAELERSSP